jgi:gluconolactonase
MGSDGLPGFIAPDAPMRRLGNGFGFTEGPIWVPQRDELLFSDIPGDSRWRWTAAGGIERIAAPTCKGNGMCLDADGCLIVCEHVSSSVTRIRDGRREVIAFHYQGRYLNSPNDAVTRFADGSIYFTDPSVGREDAWVGLVRERDLDFQGVYRIPPGGGDIELVVGRDEFETPNGLCFSPDESVLYINDTSAGQVRAYDVAAGGSLSGRRLVHEHQGRGWPHEGNFDGMECDELGNIWVTGPGGVWVIAPEGDRIGVLETPEICGSLCWGGPGLRTLFLMTSSSVHAIETQVGPALRQPGGDR